MRKYHAGCLTMLFVTLGLGLGACKRPPDDAAVMAVRENVRAFSEGDEDLARRTMHPANPLFAQTEAIFVQVRPLNLSYELERCEVVDSGPGEVRIGFTQVTRKKSAATKFRDNRVSGEHVLRLDRGAWKIRVTKIQQVEYLEPPEAP